MENWVTEEQVQEDFGFYSDMFKDEYGVRPRSYTPAELAYWCNENFKVVDSIIIKKVRERVASSALSSYI